MKRLALAPLLCLAACGTLFNSGPSTVSAPPGTSIDGSFDVTRISKKRSHMVQFADGRTCLISSRVSPLYVLGDIFLTPYLVGIVVDALTGDWRKLDADSCPGIAVD